MAGEIIHGSQIIEENARGAPVKDILWNPSQIETESIKIQDPGVGKEVILRHFFFKYVPVPKGTPNPTKQQIVAHYKKLIEMTLWGDGLIIREDKPLEVHTQKSAKKISKSLYAKMKSERADFVILCLAEPRRGVHVRETPNIAV